jgi:hypothetical protein
VSPLRWVIVVVLALALLGLIRYARGADHHHGDDVGALAPLTASVQLVAVD